jgi:hypothetical protein
MKGLACKAEAPAETEKRRTEDENGTKSQSPKIVKGKSKKSKSHLGASVLSVATLFVPFEQFVANPFLASQVFLNYKLSHFPFFISPLHPYLCGLNNNPSF